MGIRRLTVMALAGILVAVGVVFCGQAAWAQNNVMFIVDASGSMKKAVEGESRMAAAKRVLAEALASVPPETRLGLLVYGHRKAKDCTDMELVSPIGAEAAGDLSGRIQKLTPKGETPIAAALEMAAKSFAAFKGQANSIVLVTDGIEECKGDPCAAAAAIKAADLDLKVNVVGFTLKAEQRKLIECVATETGGIYYDAKNGAALKSALTAVTKTVAPDDNILAQANGGTLLAAPNDEWSKLNDGSEERATTYSGEGVWGFRDGRPATFDNIEVLIPATDQYNLKDFEVLVGDEGPTGSFRSVGSFAAQNIKMMQAPYQKFTFAPVTARYLKVVLKTDQGGGYIACYEFRVHGKLDQSAPPAQPVATASGVDLLSPANGGTLLAAPSDEWQKMTDGSPERATTYAGQAVWGFKDGKPATFDQFDVLILGTSQYNLKDFELLAGDESPTGSFRSIGQFTTYNTKLMADPFQRFTFPAVTAHFLKVVFKTDWGGGYVAAHELRLFGQIAEDGEPVQQAAAAAGNDDNVLAQSNGGTLLAAPNDEWQKLNDGNEDRATTYGGEGVWSFKDGAAATFDNFEVLIPKTDQYNLKDFELLAGDDSPTGMFRSIGVFTVQNVKMMQSPFQRFSFPPVTAKYLKVVLKTDQGGGYIACYEFRVHGTLGAAAAASTSAAAATATSPTSVEDINVLGQAAGGTLLAAPNDEWMKLNDGLDDRATTYDGEGVWAFKDEQPVTFDNFEVLIPDANQYNLKDFELLVADDGPSGPFRSIGSFTTQNTKMMQSPYQRFTFPPVTARYLKVVLRTDWGGGYIAPYEFRIMVKPAP